MSNDSPDLDDIIATRAAEAADARVADHEALHHDGSVDGPEESVTAAEVAEIATQVVSEHADGMVHLSGDDVEKLIAAEVDARGLISGAEVDRRIEGAIAGKIPTIPEPPVPPTEALRLRPDEQLVYLDPNDGGVSWGPYRPFSGPQDGRHPNWAQLIADGNRLQDGRISDELIHRLRGAGVPASQLAGYGLEWSRDLDGEWSVDGFEMDDGTTKRVGIVHHDGVKYLRLAGQWKPEGYDPSNNNKPIGGVNLALRRGPGFSGPMYYDGGPRTQYAALAKHIRTGKDADRFVMAIRFKSEAYMFGAGYTSGPMDLHAPAGAVTGPILMSTRSGVCRVWGKHVPDPIDWNQPGNLPNQANLTLAEFDLAPEGDDNTVIIAGRCTVGAGSELGVYLLRAENLYPVVETDRPYGYTFRQFDKSGMFYPIPGQVYTPHRWWPNENWNWDPSTADGNVRRVDLAWSSVVKGEEMTAERMRRHALSFI